MFLIFNSACSFHAAFRFAHFWFCISCTCFLHAKRLLQVTKIKLKLKLKNIVSLILPSVIFHAPLVICFYETYSMPRPSSFCLLAKRSKSDVQCNLRFPYNDSPCATMPRTRIMCFIYRHNHVIDIPLADAQRY